MRFDNGRTWQYCVCRAADLCGNRMAVFENRMLNASFLLREAAAASRCTARDVRFLRACLKSNDFIYCKRIRNVAQLVARLVWDQNVAGSNPVIPTYFYLAAIKKLSAESFL